MPSDMLSLESHASGWICSLSADRFHSCPGDDDAELEIDGSDRFLFSVLGYIWMNDDCFD